MVITESDVHDEQSAFGCFGYFLLCINQAPRVVVQAQIVEKQSMLKKFYYARG